MAIFNSYVKLPEGKTIEKLNKMTRGVVFRGPCGHTARPRLRLFFFFFRAAKWGEISPAIPVGL